MDCLAEAVWTAWLRQAGLHGCRQSGQLGCGRQDCSDAGKANCLDADRLTVLLLADDYLAAGSD